jgi:putative PIN family toxin of toxin-antitoxin system
MGRKVRVVLDTNILISAIGFGGKPREILKLVLDKRIKAISSYTLFAEFNDVISKKFPKLTDELDRIQKQFRKNMEIVKPSQGIHILQDEPDNRVLEAALEGNCGYIITGDNDLLNLKMYKNIVILKPDDFLANIQN